MLPHKYHTISPYLRDKTRMVLLTSGVNWGSTEIHDERYMERLEKTIESLSNGQGIILHNRHLIRDYPDLKRPKRNGDRILSDLALRDTFRQHRGISERYRRGLTGVEDVMRISDGATKYHIATSRGYERHLIETMIGMDSEFINRANLKPIIV